MHRRFAYLTVMVLRRALSRGSIREDALSRTPSSLMAGSFGLIFQRGLELGEGGFVITPPGGVGGKQ